MSERETNTARMEARLPKSVLDLIKKAAALEGRSLSDFVVGSARQAAMQSIQAHAMLQVGLDDQIQFAKALLNPNKPAPALKRAAARHRKLVESDADK